MSMLSIALTGLSTAQAGLTTTSHNIANAKVEGYSRQEALQGTNDPMYTGVGFFGQGTRTETVRRVYSQFLENQVLAANTTKSQYEVYSNEISQIDNLLADETAGLSPSLQSFFTGIKEVTNAASSIPSRQSMLSSSEALTSRFHSLNSRLEEIRDGVEQQITDSVATINSLSSQIATLNQRISLVQSSGGDQPANDLLDQRDKLISDLNKQIKVSVTEGDDGKVNLFVGNGQSIVVGTESFELAAAPSLEDPQQLAVGFVLTKSPTLTTQELPDNLISGGNLGGLLQFRSEALDSAENALGRIALGLTTTFNAQHRLGQDLNGNLGLDYFTPLKVDTTTLTNTATGVTSTAVVGVTVSDVSKVTTDDYVLSYDGANYQLTHKSDDTVVALTADPLIAGRFSTQEGLTLDVTAMSVGDRVLIQPTRNAAANISVAITDPRLIAAAAPIATAATTTNTGTAKISAGSVNSVASHIPLPGYITLSFDAANNQFNVTAFYDKATPPTVTALAPIAYTPGTNSVGLDVTLADPAISFTLSGVPSNGDAFTISNNTSGVKDNRNALLLGGLQTKKTLEGAGASFEYAYSQMVSDVGTLAHTANTNLEAQDTLLSEAQSRQQSVSGVNLDEEAANLLQYQQAYQASAKALSIASQLFDTILAIGR